MTDASIRRRDFLVATAATAALARAGGAQAPRRDANARFVWCDEKGEGRNLFARFRRTFSVAGRASSALLHVFADTSYQLFVNGAFVEFGPVRCDPRFPLYDTHDLTPYLKAGENAIAIEVNFWGLKTFKAMPVRGGLIAWGEATHGGPGIDFATGATSWRCIAPASRARYAPKLSFALQAADLYEQQTTEEGWKNVGFDDSAWPPAVELARQDGWGALEPRSIPFMSGAEVAPATAAPVCPIERGEEWHSFSVPFPHHFEELPERGDFSDFIAYSSWLYSPQAQTISVGLLYGRHWLNGEPVAKSVAALDRPMRYTQRWQLQGGWNYLFGTVDAHYDPLDLYFALPKERGLVFSTEKSASSPYAFRHSRPLTRNEYETLLKPKTLPFPAEESLAEAGGWVEVKRGDVAQNPCRETSWDRYGDAWESLAPATLDGHVFRLADYPHGFALLLDLDTMHLILPRIRLRGVRGATLDTIYTERLAPDRMHVQQFSWYPVGDRALCTLDAIDWMPANPRGARYCQITVRNAQADVTLESLRLRSASYPVQTRGWFHCSDPCLNEIWKMCQRTQAANMEDAFVDCAQRERGMYGRDTIIQYHVNLATFGDQALMRRCLQLYGQSLDGTGRFRIVYPNTGAYTHNDFALNMVEGYRAYYDYSGDAARIRADWPAIRTNLAYFHKWSERRADLLMENLAELGGFQGEAIEPASQIGVTGLSCFFSLAYLLAVQSALRLAQAIGETADARDLERRAALLARSIAQTFWDEPRRCYRDSLKGATHSVHSSLFAVRAGIVSPAQLAGIRTHVAGELRSAFLNGYDPSGGFKVSSAFAFYVFDGLYKAGLAGVAEELMREVWGYFLAQGLKTTPEFINMDQSLCHAWSASPAYYLSKYALGIEFPDAPRLDRVRINVQTGSLTAAEGSWPHPRGVIEVKWHTGNGRRVFDYVRAPAGVEIVS